MQKLAILIYNHVDSSYNSFMEVAAVMASMEFPTLSFSKMFWRWRFTVCMLIPNASAICLLGFPA